MSKRKSGDVTRIDYDIITATLTAESRLRQAQMIERETYPEVMRFTSWRTVAHMKIWNVPCEWLDDWRAIY